MKHINIATLLVMLFTFNCGIKQKEFTVVQFKLAMKIALSDQGLNERMGISQKGRYGNWILNGDFNINDTLIVDGRKYAFGKKKYFIKVIVQFYMILSTLKKNQHTLL